MKQNSPCKIAQIYFFVINSGIKDTSKLARVGYNSKSESYPLFINKMFSVLRICIAPYNKTITTNKLYNS